MDRAYMDKAYEEDRVRNLLEKAEQGKIGRRAFTRAVGALLALPVALRASLTYAQAKRLVLINWGGVAITAYDQAFGQPFEKEAGIAVKEDGSGPTEGAIIAQEKSGKVTWDIVDTDPFSSITLGAKGYLEPIDYTIVDKSKMRTGFVYEYCASSYFFSYVLCYDSARYGSNPPTSMGDIFDVKKFPGKRTLYKWGTSSWEAALLADGVAREKIYPIDLERAHARIKDLKKDVVSFWGGGAESQTTMLNGEAAMGILWSGRARLVEEASKGRIKFIWNDGILQSGAFGVMKHNPGGQEAAMKFIASAQTPERQLVMFKMLDFGPANPAADALIPADQERYNCIAPANAEKQIPLDVEWYAKHYTVALEKYLALVSA